MLQKGRPQWLRVDGRSLELTPSEGATFQTGEILGFGFMVKAPGKSEIQLKAHFHGNQGAPQTMNARSVVRGKWRQFSWNFRNWPKELRQNGVAKITLEFAEDGPYFFDDLRFTPEDIMHGETPLPPPTSQPFFPQYTEPEQIQACLNDSQLPQKLAEIQRLRRNHPFRKLEPYEYSQKHADFYAEIQPDGSISSLTPEKVRKIEADMRSHRLEHEGFSRQTAPRLGTLLRAWRMGQIERTPANKAKLLRAINYHGMIECNRRMEAGRWVTTAFWFPGVATSAYLIFLDDMEAVEAGTDTEPEHVLLNRLCKVLAANAYTQPLTNLPAPPLTVEAFRHDGAWVSGNFGYRHLIDAALVCNNPLMLDVCREVVEKGVSVISWNTRQAAFWQEGPTADGSGWGHGTQHLLFRYPSDGVTIIVETLANLKDSLWKPRLTPAQYDILLNFLRSTLWVSWKPEQYGPTLAISDRECMRFRKDGGFFTMKKMQRIGTLFQESLLPEQKELHDQIQQILLTMEGKAPEPSGNHYFWNNDDMIHRRKDYFAGIKMVSSRTRNCESTPLASSLTDFFKDGATILMAHPHTYTVAKGFWDPCAVPGTTVRQFPFQHKGTAWRTYEGCFDLAGGVSDGTFGTCGFRYGKKPIRENKDPRFYKVEAFKSYFCFENEMVCLGSGIRDLQPTEGVPLRTTIDQTEWNAPVAFRLGNPRETKVPGQDFQAQGTSLLLAHDGFGYMTLSDGDVRVQGNLRQERWLDFNVAQNSKESERPKTQNILQIQLEHAKQDASYAYLVHFRTPDLPALEAYAEELPVQILSNTKQLQAVRHNALQLLQALFFDPEAVLNDPVFGKITVDAPSAVMLCKRSDGSLQIFLSDLKQDAERTTATFTCNGKSFSFPLPQNPFCGKTTTFTIPKE
ncbi:MAG: hypothetical protein IJJ26_10430 [Victivallales bacterium]|nr:hypothetical protein [Victivallales bacterium]